MITSRGLQLEINEELKSELTVTPDVNKDYHCGFEDLSYKVFTCSKTKMYVPRNFPILVDGEISNKIADGILCDHLTFVGSLKTSTNQIDASDAVYHGLVNESNATQRQYNGNSLHCGILSLPTGYGKTTVALHVMCRLKYKTLIIVHKEFLMTQWIERIKQFVPSARIGIIQGSKVDVAHKDVVIGMLQSLSKKDYDRNIFKEFGLTIVDETHHICTRSFSKALLNYNTKYILGLSATLERKDGLTKVLHWFIGPVLYQAFRERKHDVVVEKHAFDCDMFKDEFPVNRARKANLPLAINEITENQDRNALLQNIIKDCVLRLSRKVLVLTDRRQHCLTLMNGCSYTTSGLYLGGMKPYELAESEKCSVIFGTFSLAHEGLDIPELDTLILASPKSDIVQSVGRILRETPGKKNHPLVVDIADNWGPFKGQYYKRQKYYKSTGFTILRKGDIEVEPLELEFLDD